MKRNVCERSLDRAKALGNADVFQFDLNETTRPTIPAFQYMASTAKFEAMYQTVLKGAHFWRVTFT